jgi:hypothetical protein
MTIPEIKRVLLKSSVPTAIPAPVGAEVAEIEASLRPVVDNLNETYETMAQVEATFGRRQTLVESMVAQRSSEETRQRCFWSALGGDPAAFPRRELDSHHPVKRDPDRLMSKLQTVLNKCGRGRSWTFRRPDSLQLFARARNGGAWIHVRVLEEVSSGLSSPRVMGVGFQMGGEIASNSAVLMAIAELWREWAPPALSATATCGDRKD